MIEATTPLMQQYQGIKSRYPHALLLFRLGDFYELFYEDAIIAARELQITLTSRNREKGQPIPMCGVPYHAADGYIARLIRAGFKIAICDQMELPGPGKKIVRREVVRVITPGTATDGAVLEARENNFLAAVAKDAAGTLGMAYVDLSTGEFQATVFSARRCCLVRNNCLKRPRLPCWMGPAALNRGWMNGFFNTITRNEFCGSSLEWRS